MSIVCFKSLGWLALGALVSGCGLTQTVSESTAAASRAVFSRPVTTLHLQFDAQTTPNTHDLYMNALTVATRVRIYQLSDARRFQALEYEQLLTDVDLALGDDLLAAQTRVLKPGETLSVETPLHPQAQAVAVMALLRDPDPQRQSWRATLDRAELLRNGPRVLELSDQRLNLRALEED